MKAQGKSRRLLAVVIAVWMVIGCTVFGNPGKALAADDFPDNGLIVVGGKTVWQDDTIQEVEAQFGQPKLVTDSPFGGSAYTFYGDNYSDYLYLETNADGSIAAYGSVSEGFRTAVVDFGETYRDYYVRSYRVVTDDDDKVLGFVGYTSQASLRPGAYHQAIVEDMNRYDTALCHQSVLMFNAVSALYSDNTPAVFDQSTYERTLQLGENGSNVYEYASSVAKTGNVKLIRSGQYGWEDYTYINPLFFAESALSYTLSSEINQAQFILYLSNGKYYTFVGTVNPDLYNLQTVPLTMEEQQLLSEMKEMYQHSVDVYNQADAYYQVSPSYDSLPITAGVVNPYVLQGSVEYLNTIRHGAGLPLLTLDQELCDGAQAKAAYTLYLSANGISNPSPHFPPKVEGIDDSFYALCQTGGGENLYNGDTLTSITNALNDRNGDPVTCGHRYNLLNPNYSSVGLGSAGSGLFPQGVHKFSGYQQADVDAVCWPSDGITPEEALLTDAFQWTAQLYRYSVTEDTYVAVTCLNTGKEWRFEQGDNRLYCSRSEDFLSWSDENLSVSAGDVYAVTIGNVVDHTTGQETDYTYRAVIANLYSTSEDVITSFTLDRTSYSGVSGDVVKLNAIITPNGVPNALVNWSSSDEQVASVTQNGVVTLKGTGTAVITAAANGGFIATATIVVQQETLTYDVNQDGRTDVRDVMQLAQIIVRGGSDQDLARYDYNKSGSLNVQDVMLLAQWIVRL